MVTAWIIETYYLKPALEKRRAEAEARAKAEALARKKRKVEGLIADKQFREWKQQVQEWNQRRLEASAKGEHFDEPLPDLTAP